MKSITSAFTPNATNMIRLDHTHTMATFQQYRISSKPQVKRGLANTVCLSLEVHSQLEEEIFYPALREVSDSEGITKALPEHAEMKRLIAVLRDMEPDDARYDDTFMALMRDVIHHMAEEETLILPEAERLLQDQLGELGAKMMKRKLELVAPRSADIAINMARAMPASSIALLAGATAAGVLLGRGLMRR